jgi:hypothetical protein
VLAGSFLNSLQRSAGLHRHALTDTVNLFDGCHPFERQRNFGPIGLCALHQVGEPSLGYHSLTGGMTQAQHSGHFGAGMWAHQSQRTHRRLVDPTAGALRKCLTGYHCIVAQRGPDLLDDCHHFVTLRYHRQSAWRLLAFGNYSSSLEKPGFFGEKPGFWLSSYSFCNHHSIFSITWGNFRSLSHDLLYCDNVAQTAGSLVARF